MNKALTIATLTMAMTMTTVPLTAHAETVDEANQATQTAYQAYQQAETEKTQAWNDSHGDIYSDAWQTADAKSRALYSAYLDARQHAGLVAAETNRDQSVSPNSDVSESQSSSESQSLSERQAEGQASDTQSSKVSTSNQSSSTSDQPSSDSNANLTSDAIPTVTKSASSQGETAHNSVSRTSNTLPQTGNDKKNRTALALIGGGVISIAIAVMSVYFWKPKYKRNGDD